MEVMKRAGDRQRTHGDVIHLEVGQPSTPAPALVRQTAAGLLGEHRLGYTDALGVEALREAISSHYRSTGRAVDPDQIVVTVGASGGFVLALLAAFDAGQRIGITEPGYAAYRNIIRALDLELVGIPVGPESRWVPTPDLVRGASDLDGLVIASPSNPTGTALTGDEMGSLIDACAGDQITLISDEIYQGISYVGDIPSMLDFTTDGIVVQSFSKYFSMTGWRLGWLVVPAGLVETLERLAQNLFISPPTLAQLAAVTAFDATPELDGNVQRYAMSRSMLIEACQRWGLTTAPPDGAFYLWVDVTPLGFTASDLSREWLTACGVAVTPGIDFDPHQGENHVRISFSESPEDIEEAVGRLDAWMSAGS
jgi:aspartate/methionine/tyrosine aminotransferase